MYYCGTKYLSFNSFYFIFTSANLHPLRKRISVGCKGVGQWIVACVAYRTFKLGPLLDPDCARALKDIVLQKVGSLLR